MNAVWDDEIDKRARSMLATHTVAEIARIVGCARSTCYSRLSGKKYTPESREQHNAQYRAMFPRREDEELIDARPPLELIRDRDLRAMLPHRDLTGALFGDPPIGRSALDAGRRE